VTLEACRLYSNKGLHEGAMNEAQKTEGPTLYTQTNNGGKKKLGGMPSNYTKRICTALNDLTNIS
jgi:hypothetical protein